MTGNIMIDAAGAKRHERLQTAFATTMLGAAFALGAAACVDAGKEARQEYSALSATIAQAYEATYGANRSPERLELLAKRLSAVEERIPRFVPSGSLDETAQRLHATARAYLPLNAAERQGAQRQVDNAVRALRRADGRAALYAETAELTGKTSAALFLGVAAYALAAGRRDRAAK